MNNPLSKVQPDLHGKVIAVTGGARGIGQATARALAASGATVVVGDLDVVLARESAELYGGTAKPLDVADRGSFESFLDEVVDEHGRLDGLVNNAGFMVIGRALDLPLERQLAQVDVNLNGVVIGTLAAASRMEGGTIVNVASLAGRIPMPGTAVYSATKAAVLAFTESIDAELAPRVRVGAVLPSFTNTELIDGTEATGLMAPIEPEEVAEAVVSMFGRFKATATVPTRLAFSGAQWGLMHSRIKPKVRELFGLDHAFTDPDLDRRAAYDSRTQGTPTP